MAKVKGRASTTSFRASMSSMMGPTSCHLPALPASFSRRIRVAISPALTLSLLTALAVFGPGDCVGDVAVFWLDVAVAVGATVVSWLARVFGTAHDFRSDSCIAVDVRSASRGTALSFLVNGTVIESPVLSDSLRWAAGREGTASPPGYEVDLATVVSASPPTFMGELVYSGVSTVNPMTGAPTPVLLLLHPLV